jgi:hypothetical protein
MKTVLTDLASPAQAAQASSFCSSYIASTTTLTNFATFTVGVTAQQTVPQTATAIVTATAAAPTVTSLAYSNCGLKGFDKGQAAYHFDTSNGNFAACSALCVADPQCGEFAYGSGSCLLYNATVATNFLAVDTSPYLFNDKNCPASSQPSASVAPAPASGLAASTPTTTTVAQGAPGTPQRRTLQTPPAFLKLAPALITQGCECLISKASTYTSVITKPTTVTSSTVDYKTVVVGTVTSSVFVTPAAVTSTVTTTA